MTHSSPPSPQGTAARIALCVGALGVVFGDIGTSPLYTLHTCIQHLPREDPREGVLGILSLIFWSLILVVSVKYLGFVMKADNEGEGGIFALLALVHGPANAARREKGKLRVGPAVVMILIGAALLYGDGIITPAISVLGAAEGFEAVSPKFTPFVPWTAAVILAVLFAVQHRGTRAIGRIFGPVMLLWFLALGALGTWHVAMFPGVLQALNPIHGLRLLRHPPGVVTALLGAVVLSITGAEALYADLGHFGRRSIGLAWYGVALPGLVLNYFGQGAWVLGHVHAHDNPFFALAPAGACEGALTALSIIAAIIASQALISGAFSLTRQAIELGYFPRLKITYTNPQNPGQIYLPFVNELLAVGCIATALAFRSSDSLASAYGIAVTGTMAITTGAYFVVARRNWKWPVWRAGGICGVFLVADLAFFAANARKITEGGWFPLAIAAAVLAVMHTWKMGRSAVFRRVYGETLTETELVAVARSPYVTRVPGAAVFMVGSPEGTPLALLHHVKANRCLHKTVVILSLVTEDVPYVPPSRRMKLHEIGEGISRIVGRYGYMQSPNVTDLMAEAHERGLAINPQAATFFFNREMILSGGNSGMWNWEKRLYGFLTRNARPAKDYYHITPSQIIEIGLPLPL